LFRNGINGFNLFIFFLELLYEVIFVALGFDTARGSVLDFFLYSGIRQQQTERKSNSYLNSLACFFKVMDLAFDFVQLHK
jgi:hypothetical protein